MAMTPPLPPLLHRDPTTPAEWQQAVDWSELFLRLDSARQYGLITGGPVVQVDRCVDLLARGKAQGIEPIAANVEAYLRIIGGSADCLCRTPSCGHPASAHTGPGGACAICGRECWS